MTRMFNDEKLTLLWREKKFQVITVQMIQKEKQCIQASLTL